MAKFTLLEEALIEERLEKLEEYVIDKDTPGIQIVQTLLPNFKPFTVAERLFNTRARIKRLHGGVRAGKTVHEVADDIKISWYNKPYNHLIFSPTQENANLTVGKELEELLRTNFVKYKLYKSDSLYVIYWGVGEENEAHIYNWGVGNMIKGVTAASGSWNEFYSQQRREILISEERISKESPDLWYSKLFTGTSEPDIMQHGHEEYQKPDYDTDDALKITMRTEDNPYLTREYIDDLYSKYTPEERKVYLEGIYTPLASGTRMYINFSRDKNARPYSEYLTEQRGDEEYKMILGFDFNVNPITAVLWDFKGRVRRQINEFYINRSNTKEFCEMIIDKLTLLYDGIAGMNRQKFMLYITGDASGKNEHTSSFGWTDHDIIRKCFHSSGIRCHDTFDKTNGAVIERVSYVNNLFDKQLAIIYDNCVKSIEDRELAKWKGGAEGYIADKSNKNRTHFNDGGDYGLKLTARMGIDDGSESDGDSDGLIFGGKRRFT